MGQTGKPKRRRRRPEEAEHEILEAAESLLQQRPWHEVTVEELMARTTLSRNAFYVYFRDRYELIARLLGRLREEINVGFETWREEPEDLYGTGRAALRGLVMIYVEHGALLRAVSQAAREDPAAARAWASFIEAGDTRSAERIKQDIRRGLIRDLDPDSTARALCAMNREYLFQSVVGHPEPDVDAAVDTLHEIWWRTLYGPGGRSRSSPSGP